MAGTAWRRASLAASAALLLTGCGATTQPQALTPMPDQAPADLCAMVPAAERAGLIADSTSDTADITGTPTEACSLRSQTGATPQVRTLVTWLQLDDSETALGVYESQCRAVDRTVFRVATGFKATGADRACAATSSSGSDSVTMAAVKGNAVITVRTQSQPAQKVSALTQGTQIVEGVVAALAKSS